VSRNVQYITNAEGKRTAVILSLEDYESLLEDLHVLAAAYESRNDVCIPLSELVDELRAEGKLD